jgi:hypothetical protein
MHFNIDQFWIKKFMRNFKNKIVQLVKFARIQKFYVSKWLIKLSFLMLIIYIINLLIKNFDWVNVDWYIRMNYPNLYRYLSLNIFHIFSIAITLFFILYTIIGFQLNYKLIQLPLNVILLLGVKHLLQVWFYFICTSYLTIGVFEILKFFTNRKLKKKIDFIKYSVCFVIMFYYHLWNFYNNEPLTHFVNTPDFVPESLCNNSNNINFDTAFYNFIQNHNRMMEISTPMHNRKAVIFRAYDGGLGNRIQGLLSSFLLALLLKRAFFVDWYKNEKEAYSSIDDLFQVKINSRYHNFPIFVHEI